MARGELVIPTSAEIANDVVTDVKAVFTRKFGGCSLYDGAGTWEDDNGEIVEESHTRLVVSSDDRGELERVLRQEANIVKGVLDEDAVMYEIVESDMELV